MKSCSSITSQFTLTESYTRKWPRCLSPQSFLVWVITCSFKHLNDQIHFTDFTELLRFQFKKKNMKSQPVRKKAHTFFLNCSFERFFQFSPKCLGVFRDPIWRSFQEGREPELSLSMELAKVYGEGIGGPATFHETPIATRPSWFFGS